MASISTDKRGNRRILFCEGGKRKQVRLGPVSYKAAEQVQTKIHAILERRGLGISLETETVVWLQKIPNELAIKLAAVGLMEPRVKAEAVAPVCLGEFIDRYISVRTDMKPATLRIWDRVRSLLIEHFGAERPIAGITALEARAFHAWLSSTMKKDPATKKDTDKRRFSPASVSAYMAFARQFFTAAVDDRVISTNPFKGIKLGKRSNKARQRFVDRGTIDRVLSAIKDPEFRLVVALSRYGGIRIPSELRGLLWQHIDRERGRILIHSPKTEHHENRDTREIPLWPELVPYINEWWESCPEGCEYVMASNRESESAWRSRLLKVLRRLGIAAWPRLFHNLRASRQTELEDKFPSHVVSGWMGNTQLIAREHYLQTTDDHFRTALTVSTDTRAGEAAQKAAQYAAGMEPTATNVGDGNEKTLGKSRVLQQPVGALV